jgi:hypothetical protein
MENQTVQFCGFRDPREQLSGLDGALFLDS